MLHPLWASFCRHLFIAIVCLASVDAVRAERADVYLLSSEQLMSLFADQLVPETALRLTALEAGLQGHFNAAYVPLDQVAGLDDDAYPRIRITVDKGPFPRNYLRMTRHGDTWRYYTSHDGEHYDLVGEHEQALPSDCFAGVYLSGIDENTPHDAVIRFLRIDGRDVEDLQFASADGGHASTESGSIRLHTAAGKPDWKIERASLAGTGVSGDFTLDACFEPYPGRRPSVYSGVICRELADQAGPCILMYYNNDWNACAYRDTGMRYGFAIDKSFYPTYSITITRSAGEQPEEIARATADFSTWPALCDSVQRLTDNMQAALSSELGANFRGNPDLTAPTEPQQFALAEARRLARGERSISVVQASRKINDVLSASPGCRKAWSAAAMCAVMPTMRELAGWFHNRDRYLAGPLAYLLLGERLSGDELPPSVEEQLDAAWVILACGYPDTARALCEGIDPATCDPDEATAIRIFATDDYRLAGNRDMMDADPLVTMAWIRALVRCNMLSEIKEYGMRRTEMRRCPDYLPAGVSIDVGYDHGRTALGVSLTLARDLRDLLTLKEMDPKRVLNLLKQHGCYSNDDIHVIANKLAWQAVKSPDVNSMQLLIDLYLAGRGESVPVVSFDETGQRRICTLSLHDYADLRLGYFTLRLWDRCHFLGHMFGSPSSTSQAAARFAEVFRDRLTGADTLFDIIDLSEQAKASEADAHMEGFTKTDFGRLVSTRWALYHPSTYSFLYKRNAGLVRYLGGRGAWQQECHIGVQIHHNGQEAALSNSFACRKISAFSMAPADCFMRLYNPRDLEHLVERAAYHYNAIQKLAINEEDTDRKLSLLRQMVDLAPRGFYGYTAQGRIWLKQNKPQEAIKLYRQAMKKCPYTVGSSNEVGFAAGKLAALGYVDEALELGRYSSRSGSARGEFGYAKALEAAGNVEQARQVYRGVALRYRNCVDDYIRHLLRTNSPDALIIHEITSLMDYHSEFKKTIAHDCLWMFPHNPDRMELLKKLLDRHTFDCLKLETQGLPAIVSYFTARHYQQACEMAMRLIEKDVASNTQRYWALYAARMGKLPEMEALMGAELEAFREDEMIGTHVRYALGELTAKSLIQLTGDDPIRKAYTAWTFGMEAEMAGRMDDAIAYYHTAADLKANTQSSNIPRYWLRAMDPVEPADEASPEDLNDESEQSDAG